MIESVFFELQQCFGRVFPQIGNAERFQNSRQKRRIFQFSGRDQSGSANIRIVIRQQSQQRLIKSRITGITQDAGGHQAVVFIRGNGQVGRTFDRRKNAFPTGGQQPRQRTFTHDRIVDQGFRLFAFFLSAQTAHHAYGRLPDVGIVVFLHRSDDIRQQIDNVQFFDSGQSIQADVFVRMAESLLQV